MRLVVQDANIIIDLMECDLFERFFHLDLEVVTTSLVLDETRDFRNVKDARQSYAKRGCK